MIFLKLITYSTWIHYQINTIGMVIEQCAVLPDQNRDEHSQGQAALEDRAEGLHTAAAASGILWPDCPVKSSCIVRGSFRVSDSLEFKHTHKSKPLAAWVSQWLDSHHPGAQLHVQTLAVTCLTLPHAKFKVVGDSYDICTRVHMHCREHHLIFCSPGWEQLFPYLQEAHFRGQGLQELERDPCCQAAGLCCGCASALGPGHR